ncbi:unnamed protein product [Clavelina lepadiformis]|uniref:Uncharacterized protein n=1 Tax=Clavelina lepadiformis TaxID=159417 RepID=A0ABP0FIY2_CLALP
MGSDLTDLLFPKMDEIPKAIHLGTIKRKVQKARKQPSLNIKKENGNEAVKDTSGVGLNDVNKAPQRKFSRIGFKWMPTF